MTSLLSSQIIAASTGVLLGNCNVTGFPRNDTLINTSKKESLIRWIRKSAGFAPEKIIVYAPTYRDYEIKEKNKIRPLFGYDTNKLAGFLRKEKAIIIYKLHPYQEVSVIKSSNCFIKYETSYDYSLYDLLAITDCLICDYSSVFYDFLLLNRPIIFNLYDREQYEESRGLSYEPYESFCPGIIVDNENDLLNELKDVLEYPEKNEKLRNSICEVMHRNIDFLSTKRVYQSLISYIGDNYA